MCLYGSQLLASCVITKRCHGDAEIISMAPANEFIDAYIVNEEKRIRPRAVALHFLFQIPFVQSSCLRFVGTTPS